MLLKPPIERRGVVGLFIRFLPELLIVLAIIGAVMGKKVFSDQYATTIFTQDFFEKELQVAKAQIKAAKEANKPAPAVKPLHVLLAILQGPFAKKFELKQPLDAQNAKTFLLSFDEVYATKDQIAKAHREIEEIVKSNPDKFIPIAEDVYRRLKKVYEENKGFFESIQ